MLVVPKNILYLYLVKFKQTMIEHLILKAT